MEAPAKSQSGGIVYPVWACVFFTLGALFSIYVHVSDFQQLHHIVWHRLLLTVLLCCLAAGSCLRRRRNPRPGG